MRRYTVKSSCLCLFALVFRLFVKLNVEVVGMFSLVSTVYADGVEAGADAAAGVTGAGSLVPQLVMLAGFIVIFWLLIWRPQSKRTKEHKNLINQLVKGDEVVTTGGLLGKITQVTEDFLILQVAENTELKIQRGAVGSALPKGTIKGIK